MEVPTYVTAMVVATGVVVVLAVIAVLRRARERAGAPTLMPEAVGVVLLAWLAATTALAVEGVYLPTSGGAGVPIAFLSGLGGAWFAATRIPSLRALINQPGTQQSLAALQVWRLLGVVFLILLALGKLPALWAVPDGFGDIAAALAAPFVALRLHQPMGRPWALAWNVFGLLDLVVAIGLGATAAPGPVHLFHLAPTTVVMTGFPMALVPTFLVPLSMLLHILSLRYLLGVRTAIATRVSTAARLEPSR